MSNANTTNETSPAFSRWLDTFIEEKGIDLEKTFGFDSPHVGEQWIPVGCVVEAMKVASRQEQAQIKTTIVKIDFLNGDVLHFFNHLARALAEKADEAWA